VRLVDERGQILHAAELVGILQQHAEHVVGKVGGEVIGDPARASSTARVCGQVRAETRNVLRGAGRRAWTRCSSVIASPAAVASSSSDALATSIPVKSLTIVWKLRSDSRRPWAISAWYGVYGVYQPGFSKTLRRMAAGVIVS
jgi:hypothetical protein